ncbi:MAG: hypothetical protein SFW07_04155 [Gammaproteobacteria bacterium]|nr:hypothetical protein [Gammaproteobacteria bacterium]
MADEQWDEWNQKLDRAAERTQRYIQHYRKKAERCSDPEKIERYNSKVTWAVTMFQNKMAQIKAKLDVQNQRIPELEIPTIKCGG